MKNLLVTVALAAFAVSSSAAIQYEFQETTRSDIESKPASQLVGRAVVDGQKSRIDFVAGNVYPPGTYMISLDGSKNLTFVDPASKSFTQINAAGVVSSIGAAKITVENLQSNVVQLDDHPMIADFPTDHYQLTVTYDMTVTFGNIPVKQKIRTVVDKWTTVAFGDVADSFMTATVVRTGNPKLDELIQLEETKIGGFPLRQLVQITTTNMRGSAPGSKLAVSPTRTHRREMTITSIKQAAPRPLDFIIPPAYVKATPSQKDSDVTILSMEPAGK